MAKNGENAAVHSISILMKGPSRNTKVFSRRNVLISYVSSMCIPKSFTRLPASKCLYKSARNLVITALNSCFGKAILQAVYGFQDEATLSHFVELNEKVLEVIMEIVIPGNFWVDFLPWLRHIPSWFPGAAFHGRAAYFRKSMLSVLDEPINFLRMNTMVSGSRTSNYL